MPRPVSAAIALLAASLIASAPAGANPIPAPDEWRGQSRAFPLEFAPAIGFEGHEHVRFAPGFARFDTEEAFSYVILWDVKAVEGPALTLTGLRFAIASYFDGLMAGAANARQRQFTATPSHVVFHPLRAVPEWDEAHAGDLYTWNAFADGEPVLLQVEMTRRACPGDRRQIFLAISRAKRTQPVWSSLRAARAKTSCALRSINPGHHKP
jgi:hypothetical protein